MKDRFFAQMAQRAAGNGPRLVPARRSRYEAVPEGVDITIDIRDEGWEVPSIRPASPAGRPPEEKQAGPVASRRRKAESIVPPILAPVTQGVGGEASPSATGEAASLIRVTSAWEHELALVPAAPAPSEPEARALAPDESDQLVTRVGARPPNDPQNPVSHQERQDEGSWKAEPAVHVHIGRIDVRAIHRPPAPPEPRRQPRALPSLADHLRARNEGKR